MRRKLSVPLLVLMLGAGCSLTPIQMPLEDKGAPQYQADSAAKLDRPIKVFDALHPVGGDCLGCAWSGDRGDAGDVGSRDGLGDRASGERSAITELGPPPDGQSTDASTPGKKD